MGERARKSTDESFQMWLFVAYLSNGSLSSGSLSSGSLGSGSSRGSLGLLLIGKATSLVVDSGDLLLDLGGNTGDLLTGGGLKGL
jgi:hypothetical protein